MSIAFTRRLTVTASTKRSPTPSAGLVGVPVAHLATLRTTPLDPASAEVMARYGTGAPQLLRRCYCPRADVRAGDRLVVDGREYPIRAVEDWVGMGAINAYQALIVEDIQA